MQKEFAFEFKQLATEGSFEGILSPYNIVDHGNDLIERGAYVKTLKERGPVRPLLWQHKSDSPIGQLTLEDRSDGLYCRGQLLMELPDAQKAYLLIKHKIINGLSIGFQSMKDGIEGGVRHLKEISLFEGSIVTFPMAPDALIATVKALEGNSAHAGVIRAVDDMRLLLKVETMRMSLTQNTTRPRAGR